MKTKILTFVLLLGLSSFLVAQTKEKGPNKAFRGPEREMRLNSEERGPVNGLNLTDAQKETFKKMMMETQKQLQPLRNQVGEADAHQKTLITAEKPDLALINKNIEKIGALRIEMAKIRTKNRLDMRSQLTEEQRLKFDLFAGKMMQEKWKKGTKRGMPMNSEQFVN